MKENKDKNKNLVKNRTKKKHKLLTEIRFSTEMKELCSDTINISNVENDENGKSNDNQIDKNENHENNYNVNHDNNVRKGLYDENNNTKKIHECHTDENENKTECKSDVDLIKRKVDERLAIKLNKIISTLLL